MSQVQLDKHFKIHRIYQPWLDPGKRSGTAKHLLFSQYYSMYSLYCYVCLCVYKYIVTFPIVFSRGCSVISPYGKCFTKVDHTTMPQRTWNESKNECSNHDQSLASILSPNEERLVDVISLGKDTWIGLSDLENEGQFVWVDGSTFNSIAWNTGNPRDSTDYNCVVYRTGVYTDIRCDDTRYLHVCSSTGE